MIDVLTTNPITLEIATFISTAGIVSVEVLAINYHRHVIQGTTVVVVTIVAGWVVLYPVLTMEQSKEQFTLHNNMAVVTQGQHLFGCKIVALFMFTTSSDMPRVAITVTVDLMITPAPFDPHHQQLLQFQVQSHLLLLGMDATLIVP